MELVQRHAIDASGNPFVISNYGIILLTRRQPATETYVRIRYSHTTANGSPILDVLTDSTNFCSRVLATGKGEINLFWRGNPDESCLVYFRPLASHSFWWTSIGIQNAIVTESNQFRFWKWTEDAPEPLTDVDISEGSFAWPVLLYVQTYTGVFQVDIGLKYEFGQVRGIINANDQTENAYAHIERYPGIFDKHHLIGSFLMQFQMHIENARVRIMVDAGEDVTVEIYTQAFRTYGLDLFYQHRPDLQRTVVDVPQMVLVLITAHALTDQNYVRVNYKLTKHEATSNMKLTNNPVNLCSRVSRMENGEINLLWRGESKQSCLVLFILKVEETLHWTISGVQDTPTLELNQIHFWMGNHNTMKPLRTAGKQSGSTKLATFLYAESFSKPFLVDISISYKLVQSGVSPTLTSACDHTLSTFPGVFDKHQLRTTCMLSTAGEKINENVKITVEAGVDVAVEIFTQSTNSLTLVRRHQKDLHLHSIVVPHFALVLITGHAATSENYVRIAYSLTSEQADNAEEYTSDPRCRFHESKTFPLLGTEKQQTMATCKCDCCWRIVCIFNLHVS